MVEMVVMNQPTKMETVPAENDEPGQRPEVVAGSLVAFARAQGWFVAVAVAVLLATWLVLLAVGVDQGGRLVALAWVACFCGALQSRAVAHVLLRVGMGGERHLVGVVLRPIFPLALFLALTILKSPLADVPLAIVLVVIYGAVLLADTVTMVYCLDDNSVSGLDAKRQATLGSF